MKNPYTNLVITHTGLETQAFERKAGETKEDIYRFTVGQGGKTDFRFAR